MISEFQDSQGGTLSQTLQTKAEKQVFSSPSPKTKLIQDGDTIDKHGLHFHIILSFCVHVTLKQISFSLSEYLKIHNPDLFLQYI